MKRSSLVNNHVMYSWKTLVLLSKFCSRSSSTTFVGPLRSSTVEASWKFHSALLLNLLFRSLSGKYLVLLLWKLLLVSPTAKRFVPSDVCCHGCGFARSFTTRQRDFLFRYRIFRKLRCPCRSRPVRAVVSLGNKGLSRYHRPTFLACAREVPSYRRRDGSFPVKAPQAQRASRGLA